MMHSNPFSTVGHDLSELRRSIEQKADRHEVSSLHSNVDRLERSIDMARDEQRREIDGLRARVEELERNFGDYPLLDRRGSSDGL